MLSAVDLYTLEKKLGATAAKKLTVGIKAAINNSTTPITGLGLKSKATAKYKNNRLQRLVIEAPHYIFKQHYGFEGVKKNGVTMRLQPTRAINVALNYSNVLPELVDEIGKLRSEEVISKLNF